MKSTIKSAFAIAILAASSLAASAQFAEIQYHNKNDQHGKNRFETSKDDSVMFTGQKL